MSKQYGLILPKNQKVQTLGKVSLVRPSIFNDDSDDDAPVAPKKPTGISKLKSQDLIDQAKALEEDPTVYQYDEIYDDMEKTKKETLLSKTDVEKKPKYITKLLETAERRKREHERRIERQVQKERDAEGDEFKDKEAFVTSSYKKKLEELKALEEAEKREEYLESIGDVTKQGNLDGFYRHLYDQKVNYETKETKKKESTEENTSTNRTTNENAENSVKLNRKNRKYRKTRASDNEQSGNEDETVESIKKEPLQSNLDADSDFSIDSSSDDEADEKKTETTESANETRGNVLSDNAAMAAKDVDADIKESKDTVVKETNNEVVEEEPEPKKPKIDIWKKRTVGDVFDAALQRYFERKALRESGNG